MKRLMTMLLSVMVLSVTAAFAQYTAKGVVVDSRGETVIGATVIQVGTVNGTRQVWTAILSDSSFWRDYVEISFWVTRRNHYRRSGVSCKDCDAG